MKRLPETLYVELVDPGTDDEYLKATAERAHEHVEAGQTCRVGVYKLVGHVELDATVNIGELKPVKAKK